MAKEGAVPPRRPKKVHHEEAHGGSWKVAYADFVTAMMALFMVLWIMSQEPEVRENIATYFANPGRIPTLDNVEGSVNAGPGVLDNLPVINPLDGGQGIMPSMEEMAQLAREEKQDMTKAAAKIEQELHGNPDLEGVADSVRVSMTDEGMRIELMDQVSGLFFNLGSAVPSQQLKSALSTILGSLEGMDNQITIEGHTDARPFPGGNTGYSNWELSADRANTVRRLMMAKGVDDARIDDVRAYADRMPLPDTDPLDGRNRRISILVKSKYAAPEDVKPDAIDRPDLNPIQRKALREYQ